MAELANILLQVKANEIAQAEAQITGHINALLPPVSELDNDTQWHLAAFIQYCANAGVRHLPGQPAICAAFFLNQARSGVAPDRIAAEAQAIELLHDHYGLANPIQTRAARWALARVLPSIEAPRSWTKEEKELFTELPVQIQTVVARREQNRETQLRRGQNEIAEMKKRLQADAEKSADNTTTEKENEMAKKEGWQRGVGPYSNPTGEDPIAKRTDPNKWDAKDISAKVDPSWKRTDGFSAKLDKGGE